MEKPQIQLPISKSYIITFVENYIQMKFFKDENLTIDSLKSLIFPPEYSDVNFNNFISFLTIILNTIIYDKKTNFEGLKSTISDKCNFSFYDEHLATISEVINKRRNDIISTLGLKYEGNYLYSDMTWSVNSILSSSFDDFYNDRYSEVQISLLKPSDKTDSKQNKENNKLISFTMNKDDVKMVSNEITKIKSSLAKLKSAANANPTR